MAGEKKGAFVEEGMKDLEVGLELLGIIQSIKKPVNVVVDGKQWTIDLSTRKIVKGELAASPEFQLETTEEHLQALLSQKLDPMQAVLQGKLKIKGNMSHAMKLQALRGKLLKIRAKY